MKFDFLLSTVSGSQGAGPASRAGPPPLRCRLRQGDKLLSPSPPVKRTGGDAHDSSTNGDGGGERAGMGAGRGERGWHGPGGVRANGDKK